MESNPTVTKNPNRWRLACAGGCIGLLAGACLGALDGLLALFNSGLVFENPVVGLGEVALFYAIVVGLLGFLGGLLKKRPVDSVSGAIAIMLIAVLSRFVLIDIFGGKGLLATAPILTMLGVLVICDITRRGVTKLIQHSASVQIFVGGVFAIHLLAWALVPSTQTLRKVPRQASEQRPPNLVTIMIDTLRADRLSCYGYNRPTSPVIDALATEGIRFDRAWAQSPWTRPSVATLFTSLYPSTHGTWGQADKLTSSAQLIAESFKEAGYHTAAFSANVQVSPTFGFSRGFDWFWNDKNPKVLQASKIGRLWKKTRQLLISTFLPHLMQRAGNHGILRGTDARTVNTTVLDWANQLPQNTPTFLYVHYLDPHQPYNPPEDLINTRPIDPVATNARLQIPWDFSPFHPDSPESKYPEPESDLLEDLNDLYDAEIRFVDREIGQLLSSLKEKEILTDSDYLLILSDHGEEFYDHFQWRHGNSLFEEMIRVPLILIGPGIPAQVFSDPVQLADLFPTLASLMGIRAPEKSNGIDLTPMLQAGQAPQSRIVYSERPKEGAFLRAISQGATKVIGLGDLGTDIKWMTFNLDSNPKEIFSVSPNSPKTNALRDSLIEIGTSALAARLAGSQAALDPATRAQLDALGYVDGDS